MGKDKRSILLPEQDIMFSVSMEGRILAHLRATTQLIEPPSAASWHPHTRHARPYAIRKPKDYVAAHPGDLLQLDTMELCPTAWVIRRHFTGIDLVSRASVVTVRATASASLHDFEHTSNHIRPHHALRCRTSAAVLAASGCVAHLPNE